jgi:hypothetical protein
MRTLTYVKIFTHTSTNDMLPVLRTGVIRLATPTLSGCFQFSRSLGWSCFGFGSAYQTPHPRKAPIQLPGETRAKLLASVWPELTYRT